MTPQEQFRIGLAIWSFKNWVGGFYPARSRADEFLSLYSQRLTAVEGNTTFYATPPAETVAKWAAQMPEGFHFCPKIPKAVSHEGALRPHRELAQRFLRRMQGLGSNLGPCFLQLPPGYGPDMQRDLANFLGAWPRDEAPIAVELRHPAWFQAPHAQAVHTMLSRLGVGRVVLDTRPIYEAEPGTVVEQTMHKPHLPLATEVSGEAAFVRLITHPARPDLNEPYLREWAWRVDKWLQQGVRVHFFIHCPDDTHSPGTLRRFHELLEARGAAVPPLPWASVKAPPSQLKLF